MKAEAKRVKHAPGPWEVMVLPDGSYHIKNGRSFHPNVKSANARLIEAAPDLLEALQSLLNSAGAGSLSRQQAEQKARDAIRSAT